MISFLLVLKRFARLLRFGWDDHEFRGLGLVLMLWIAFGTITYSINENWSVVDSLYFSVMTLTTIGYGDFAPTGSLMRLYTVVYALLGIGFFVAFNARVVQLSFALQRNRRAGSHDDHSDS